MEKEYKNVGYFFLILLVMTGLGFFKTYFGLFPQFDASTTVVVHIHAFLLVLWLMVLVAQPLLIRYKKTGLHRALGKVSYVLVPLIICSFMLMMIKRYHEGQLMPELTPGQNVKRLLLPFADMILLASFYTLAIVNRRNTPLHMRYMIATAMIFINPTLTRIGRLWFHFVFFKAEVITIIVTDLILFALIYYDTTNHRSYKPYVVSLAFFLVYQISFFIFFG